MIDPAYLAPDFHVDADHPDVVAYVAPHRHDDPIQAAVSLYLAVRDDFPYNPWNLYFEPEAWKASAVLARGQQGAHCIDKAMVLAAGARALGIPSRLHFANVRNHLGTSALEAKLGTDLLVYHGYTELFLDGKWVAATPAFNRALCERLGVPPLAFDGRTDSVFQEYARERGRFMEYVDDHGSHATLPLKAMFDAWRHHYGTSAHTGWVRNG